MDVDPEAPIGVLASTLDRQMADDARTHMSLALAHIRAARRKLISLGFSVEYADTFRRDACRAIERVQANITQQWGLSD